MRQPEASTRQGASRRNESSGKNPRPSHDKGEQGRQRHRRKQGRPRRQSQAGCRHPRKPDIEQAPARLRHHVAHEPDKTARNGIPEGPDRVDDISEHRCEKECRNYRQPCQFLCWQQRNHQHEYCGIYNGASRACGGEFLELIEFRHIHENILPALNAFRFQLAASRWPPETLTTMRRKEGFCIVGQEHGTVPSMQTPSWQALPVAIGTPRHTPIGIAGSKSPNPIGNSFRATEFQRENGPPPPPPTTWK